MTERGDSTVHIRDFCPAVGVAESAAAGTTNAALSCYLLSHGTIAADTSGRVTVVAEQGMEIGRPSRIETQIDVAGGKIARLRVGGAATKVAEGNLSLHTIRT